jgi:type VI secretion system protein ImpC
MADTTDNKINADQAVLPQIVAQGRMVRDDSEDAKKRAETLVVEFVRQFGDLDETKKQQVGGSIYALMNELLAGIDARLSKQVNAILHHPDMQKLEGTWRGLHYLVSNTETGTMLKLRVLNVTKDEVKKDLKTASEFDQSALFKKVYEEEYGTFGGSPYSLLLADYEFGRHPENDFELLENLSKVAAAAHAPVITAASPRLFDMDSFTELGNPRDLAKLFESTELAKWTSFRASEDSRYVTMALPRILLRLPYGKDTLPVEAFAMEEEIRQHSDYCWGNASYALGLRITTAFAKYRWCAAIRGLEGGGKVSGLPAHSFQTDEGDKVLKCPTELAITDRREKELDGLGFVSLCHCKGTDFAVFFGGQTTQKPKVYDTPQASANSALSARLPYILAAARFAHYLKVICRDKVGSFQTAGTLALYLNRWINAYVLAIDDAGQELKAQYPLREARVDVFDVPGKPGAYRAVAFLRPHFQLEELTTSIRLVAALPPPAAA